MALTETVVDETKPKTRKTAVAKVERQEVAPVDRDAAALSMIERIMTDPTASVERANQAFDFYQKVQADQARRAFDEAVADAKAEFPAIVKNSTGHNSIKYADFAAYARAVDPVLSRHGLHYRFRTTQNERINVTCVLSHRSGHSEENTLSGPPDTTGSKNAIQAIGSTLSYLQRYTLAQSLGLAASQDDDGRAATSETLTEDQVETLFDLIAETASNVDQFLAAAKVAPFEDGDERGIDAIKTKLGEVRAKEFARLKGLLETKKRKAARS